MTVSELKAEMEKLEKQGKGDYEVRYEACCFFYGPFTVEDDCKIVNLDYQDCPNGDMKEVEYENQN